MLYLPFPGHQLCHAVPAGSFGSIGGAECGKQCKLIRCPKTGDQNCIEILSNLGWPISWEMVMWLHVTDDYGAPK